MSRRRSLAVLFTVLALHACGDDSGAGASIFVTAVDGAPGGALLSVWVEPGTASRAWMVGGYVGVDPAAVPDGRAGRLVRYDRGVLTTVCTTDRALWWVDVERVDGRETVWAAGEGARVIRWRDGRCETVPVDEGWTGAPTFWSVLVRAPGDVWFAGGSSADGPRGVLAHWNGERVVRDDAGLPEGARVRNLYKLARRGDAMVLVGDGGTLLERDADGVWRAPEGAAEIGRARMFTVSCEGLTGRCAAVGGDAQGVMWLRDGGRWRPWLAELALPGLAGVWMQDANSVFAVGAHGATVHTNLVTAYRPPTPETRAGLHAVAGNGALVIAVGGELDTADATQRAVVLVRGAAGARFTFDGRTSQASGTARPTLGAGVGGAQ